MSFLVLVLGAMLSLGGVVSIYSGYGIVEVERGWTAVIAGTTALSAGVITIGIAFILRCLTRLQAFLEAEKGFMPLLSEIALHRAAYYPRPTTSLTNGFEGSSAAGAQPAVLVGVAPDVSLTAAKEPEAEARSSPVPAQGADPSRAATLEIFEATSRTEARAVVSNGLVDQTGAVETRSAIAGPQTDAADAPAQACESTLPDDDAQEAPEPHGVLSPALGVAAVETFGHDSAGLEPGMPALTPDSGIEAEPPAAARDAEGTTWPGSEASGQSEGPLQDNHGQRTVTGRYEADGTSYVMYSDGSIDALSANGAFQFQSMAELKAFMEARS